MNSSNNFQKGFTLIETMVTVLIVTILLSFVIKIYANDVIFWHKSVAASEVTESLRIGIDRLSRELRQANGICEIENNSIKFYDDENRLITYFIFNGNQLNRRVSGYYSSMPIVNNVIGINAMFNENKHLVTITLTGKKGNLEKTSISTSICLRTLIDN